MERIIRKKLSFKEKVELFFIRFQKIKLDEKIFFTKNLLVMIKAGLSLAHALEISVEQTKNKKFKSILKKVKKEIEEGYSLADSLAKYPGIFSEVVVNMIEAGERSGKLEIVLEEISLQMKKTREISSKLRRALTYPIFVISIMILIGIFALLYIIPKMMTILTEMNVELPLPTRILIFLSNFVIQKGHFLLIVIFLLALCFWRIVRTKKGRYALDSFLLKIPIIGMLLKKINLIKFSRTFSSLLASGIPLVQTFQITSRVLNNTVYQKKIMILSKETTTGATITSILQKDPDLFPPVITQMIGVGEKTGTLETILEDIIQFYEDDVDETLTNFTSIIEPFLIVILGIGVAIMAMAIIMPMYSLVETV